MNNNNTKQPQLINSYGRASAALIDQNSSTLLSSMLIDHDGDLAITTSSTIPSTGSVVQTNKSKNHNNAKIMAAFDQTPQDEPSHRHQPALVAFDVPNMGRMAVHRSEVIQIQGMSEANFQSMDAQSSASSSGSNTSAGLSVESMSSIQTASTPVEEQSFDSAIHSFLVDPEQESSKASSSKLQSSSLIAILREATANLPKKNNAVTPFLLNLESTQSTEACKPRLDGVRMPKLDWPDSIDGPWSTASEQVKLQQAKKKRAIQRWLEEESDEDVPATETSVQQHPMIAKVMIDRKRQEDVIRSIASFQASTFTTPTKKSKRGRKKGIQNSSSSSKPLSKSKLAKLRRSKVQTPSSLRNHYIPDSGSSSGGLATPRRKMGSINAQIGCQCGRTDDGTPMVQCDGCNMWYHMGCIGLTDSSALNEDEWYCLVCCEVATSTLTPSSTLSGGLIVTPSFPRSAALAGQQVRLSQGQLPVFYQCDDTPMDFRRDVSSALALAPSPVVPSSAMTGGRRTSVAAGRSRASRYGRHFAEPGSPLERKSNAVPHPYISGHRRNLSGSGMANGMNSFRTFAHVHSDGDLYGTTLASTNGGESSNAVTAYLRTPSPRLMSASTVQRQRQRSSIGFASGQTLGNRSLTDEMNGSLKRSHQRMESNTRQADSDDVFSTPSRILRDASSWGQHTGSMRHGREDSFASMHTGTIVGGGLPTVTGTPWGLSTPTRHLMDAGFNSDYSAGAAGGLPSLVHSSGGLDLEDMSSWHTLQNSPTSHTQAATRRARQISHSSGRRESVLGGGGGGGNNDLYSSSMRELTPERGTSFGYDIGSSSPFPKTPTFSSDPYPHLQNSSVTPTASSRSIANTNNNNSKYASFSRSINGLSPMSSPTTSHSRGGGRFAKGRLGSLGGSAGGLQGPVELRSANNASSQQIKTDAQTKVRTRDTTTEMMAGLGIGFDLNEEVDWS